MQTYLNKKKDGSQRTSENLSSTNNFQATFQFVDNRTETLLQRKLKEGIDNSPQSKKAAQFQAMADSHTAKQFSIQKKENKTGLPDNLKSGVENLSGYSMDDVKVHYNSDKPTQLQAHAYAQGTDIHLASGQEKHLPHEAWHVVQQKQGRVKPTLQMKGEVNVNDDKGLEKEADVMGGKALQSGRPHQLKHTGAPKGKNENSADGRSKLFSKNSLFPIQRIVHDNPRFVIHTPAALSNPALARLQSVLTTLTTTLHNDNTMDIGHLIVSVEAEGG